MPSFFSRYNLIGSNAFFSAGASPELKWAITSLPGMPLASSSVLSRQPASINKFTNKKRPENNFFIAAVLFVKFQIFYITGNLAQLVVLRILHGNERHVLRV